MTTSSEPTIVDPARRPTDAGLRALGVEYLRVTYVHEQRYRCEAWHLTDGEVVVIVTENGGASLITAPRRCRRWSANAGGTRT
ncbi:hypothetical protein IF650_19460 [Cellulosimicrobium terreum]|nr:hypothetical protein [Cellulosimicrobium terreum]